jgi:hypothetical protein
MELCKKRNVRVNPRVLSKTEGLESVDGCVTSSSFFFFFKNVFMTYHLGQSREALMALLLIISERRHLRRVGSLTTSLS